nr:9484_t:CDS:2 [Entrophospora candida]
MSTSVSTTTEPQLYFEARITEDSVKKFYLIMRLATSNYTSLDFYTKPEELIMTVSCKMDKPMKTNFTRDFFTSYNVTNSHCYSIQSAGIKEIIKKEINDFEEVDELTIKVKSDELTFSYILHCMITETIDTDWSIPECNNLVCVEYSSEILKHIIEGIHKYTREIRLTFHPDATSIESIKNPYDRHRGSNAMFQAKRIFPRSNFTIYDLMQPVNCTVLRKTFKHFLYITKSFKNELRIHFMMENEDIPLSHLYLSSKFENKINVYAVLDAIVITDEGFCFCSL